ncbi:MAG: trypsin-like peptidase domain-containing protein [Myxococcales bacterium]
MTKLVRSPRSQCGATADFIAINSYQGDIADAQVREDAVVLVNGDCTGTLMSRPTDLLAIIQHPRARPKVIAEGTLAGACRDRVYYADIDTLDGSSGAGVLNRQGYLLAVHSDGDCATDGSGTNAGWSAASIVAASGYLQPADIADR